MKASPASLPLQALAAFVQTATTATRYVQEQYNPAEPVPTSHIVSRLRYFFKEHLKPALKGLDPDFAQKLRQLYLGHVTKLHAGYHGFYIAAKAKNDPYTSTWEYTMISHDWANKSLDMYVNWATRLTDELLFPPEPKCT